MFNKEKFNSSLKSLKTKIDVNNVYFGFLLLCLLALNIYHISLVTTNVSGSPLFFLLYAIGQSVLEIAVITLIGNWICKRAHRFVYYLYIVFSFLLVLCHVIDFILTRFMDLSFMTSLSLMLDETYENFIELLVLTGIPLEMWVMMLFGVVVVLPILALSVYFLTLRIAKKIPSSLSQKKLMKALFFIPLGMFAMDFTFSGYVPEADHMFYERLLPWKMTFISGRIGTVDLETPLKELPSEAKCQKDIGEAIITASHKPNIYLIISESLRRDFMVEKTAPHLHAFAQENVEYANSFSNANYTNCSWYTIFHSNQPYYFGVKGQDEQSLGSVPLNLLKKAGYNIHVYSAAQLKYYNIDQIVFGKKRHLADSLNFYPHYPPTEAHESDQSAFNHFMADLKGEHGQNGNLYILFLDSTHFHYSFPDNHPVPYTEYAESATQLQMSSGQNEVTLLQNRYRNSIHFIDSLFGNLVDHLKKENLYDESVIIFTGDHGEEHYEQGQLFHASHLSQMQTEVPLYYKFGDNARFKDVNLNSNTSHIDIFPTLLDYVLKDNACQDLYQGQSLFLKDRFPYVISARFNGGRSPFEFCIHSGTEKVTARFDSRRAPLTSKRLEIIKVADPQDNHLEFESKEVCKEHVLKAFEGAFKHLVMP